MICGYCDPASEIERNHANVFVIKVKFLVSMFKSSKDLREKDFEGFVFL